MTSDDDDALTWDDATDDATHVDFRPTSSAAAVDPAVASTGTALTAAAPAPAAAGSALLVVYGIVAGAYLLFTIGWILSALTDRIPFNDLLLEIMRQLGQFLAIVAPALWFSAVFLLGRHRSALVRIVWLVVGAVLLAPWPFILGGAS